MKSFIKFIFGTTFFILSLISFQEASFAARVDYSVQAIPAEFQQNKQVTYYDLRVAPNDKKKIYVLVKNSSDNAIKIKTFIDKATTNSNGVVEYKNSSNFESINLKYDISKIIKPEKKDITIEAHKTEKIAYNIIMPPNDFDGELVGGVNFIQNNPETEANNPAEKSSMAVKNQYAYTISVVLHGKKELDKNDVNLGEIKADQINGRNSIQIPIQNKTAAFLNKVQVKAVVKKEKSQSIVYQDQKFDGQIAPNSVYKYELSTNSENLKPGEYVATVKIISKKQQWNFEKKFSIKASESEKLNKKAVIKKKSNTYIYIILGILLILILVIFIGYKFYKKNKEIKELNDQLKNNRKK
jgi:hypothetical protein